MPTCIHIVDLRVCRITHTVSLLTAVRNIYFHRNTLWFLSMQGDLIYNWSCEGARSVQIPAGKAFCARELEWPPLTNGDDMMLGIWDRDYCCVAFMSTNEE